jgi:hypothetical protein
MLHGVQRGDREPQKAHLDMRHQCELVPRGGVLAMRTFLQRSRKSWRWVVRTAVSASARFQRWRAARRALRELVLGREPDGSTVVLDYGTGQMLQRHPEWWRACDAPVVCFEQATLAWLERVISLGGYVVRRDDDDDIEVRTEIGALYVRRCDDATVIRFFARVTSDTEFMGSERLDVVNTLNVEAKQARWLLNDEQELFVSCELNADVGITSAQVLRTLRACTHEACSAVAHLGLSGHS